MFYKKKYVRIKTRVDNKSVFVNLNRQAFND